MEKKTIGGFIAALRKASGLTQRQLAEHLGVSDKTVSRWERDESAPDLSLIPVIAELFGITSDELLRGERRTEDASPSPKKQEKQLARLLAQTRLQYRVRTIISCGITLAGLVIALFLSQIDGLRDRNLWSFCLNLLFSLGALVNQAIAAMTCLGQIDTESFPSGEISALKQDILECGSNTGILILALTAGATLLLNTSLDIWEILFLGCPLSAAILFVCFLLKWFVFLPRKENTVLHTLRTSTAANVSAVAGFALMFTAFFGLCFEWSELLVVGLLFMGLSIPIGLGIYYYKRKRL